MSSFGQLGCPCEMRGLEQNGLSKRTEMPSQILTYF